MYKEKTVGVVVPAHNEEILIEKVIVGMPKFVDKIIVVDDVSKDKTVEKVESCKKSIGEKLILIKHEKNQGVGGSIITGYKWARDNDIDVTVVMAGDAQMDPEDLPALLDPVVNDEVDYSKGNRLLTGDAWKQIPRIRYLGNAALSFLTKIASGYWHVVDSQTGYTAVNKKVLNTLKLDRVYKRYGMPNDFLVRLNVYNFRIRDIPIKPVYNIGEKSGIRISKVIFTIPVLLIRLFFWRMKEKYIIRDFHPLILFYGLGLVLFPLGSLFGLYLMIYRIFVGGVETTSALFAVFLFITGIQSLFFAMWFDMEYNKDLR